MDFCSLSQLCVHLFVTSSELCLKLFNLSCLVADLFVDFVFQFLNFLILTSLERFRAILNVLLNLKDPTSPLFSVTFKLIELICVLIDWLYDEKISIFISAKIFQTKEHPFKWYTPHLFLTNKYRFLFHHVIKSVRHVCNYHVQVDNLSHESDGEEQDE